MQCSREYKKRFEFKDGANVLLIAGSHVGITGTVVKVVKALTDEDKVIIKTNKEEFTTLKKYTFVIGDVKLQ